jgi:hypothetical protein
VPDDDGDGVGEAVEDGESEAEPEADIEGYTVPDELAVRLWLAARLRDGLGKGVAARNAANKSI